MNLLRPSYLVCALVFSATFFIGISDLRADAVHRVKRHDTLTSVARQHGVTVAELAARNKMRSTDHLSVGQLLVIPGSNPKTNESSSEYVVKSGDSLAAIADKFKVKVADLVELNRIKKPDDIKVGQRLKIPGKTVAMDSELPSDLKSKLSQINVAKKRWRYIVVHHSGTQLDTALSMDRYHRNERHMENGLAYHFVIGNGVRTKDGEIYIGQRWRKQLDGGHLRSVAQNKVSIGICLIGDFNKRPPTEKQLASARALIAYLMDRCDLSKSSVKTHRQINSKPTECPGSKFPSQKLIAALP